MVPIGSRPVNEMHGEASCLSIAASCHFGVGIVLRRDFVFLRKRTCQIGRGRINFAYARATLPWHSFLFGFRLHSSFLHGVRRRRYREYRGDESNRHEWHGWRRRRKWFGRRRWRWIQQQFGIEFFQLVEFVQFIQFVGNGRKRRRGRSWRGNGEFVQFIQLGYGRSVYERLSAQHV